MFEGERRYGKRVVAENSWGIVGRKEETDDVVIDIFVRVKLVTLV